MSDDKPDYTTQTQQYAVELGRSLGGPVSFDRFMPEYSRVAMRREQRIVQIGSMLQGSKALTDEYVTTLGMMTVDELDEEYRRVTTEGVVIHEAVQVEGEDSPRPEWREFYDQSSWAKIEAWIDTHGVSVMPWQRRTLQAMYESADRASLGRPRTPLGEPRPLKLDPHTKPKPGVKPKGRRRRRR